MFNPWAGKSPWRRESLPTPVFWPREFHGLYSSGGRKESDITERLSLSLVFVKAPQMMKGHNGSWVLSWKSVIRTCQDLVNSSHAKTLVFYLGLVQMLSVYFCCCCFVVFSLFFIFSSYESSLLSLRKDLCFFVNKGPDIQSYGFSSSHVWMWELDHKEGWAPKNWWFWTVIWRRLLRVPWTARRSNQSILKKISPEYSLEGLVLKLKLQYFGCLMQSRLIGKDPDAGKDWR